MGLAELQSRLSKVKGTHVSVLSQSEIASTKEWMPTPALDLNRILSGSLFRGLPSKTFTLFIGPEATGKSSFMCLCLSEAQKQGYTPVVIDTEGAWTSDFVTRWNLDADNMLYIYTPWIDKVISTLGEIIQSEEKKIALVIDSIGGLERYKVMTDIIGNDGGVAQAAKADQGQLQKEIKRMLKMIVNVCKAQGSIAMGAGHYYGNPTGYGDPEQIGGGKYIRLAADTIVSLKRTKLWENPKATGVAKGSVIGSLVKACTLKNRYYPPFEEAIVEINYQDGINKYAGMLDLLVKADLATLGGGGWYNIDGEKYQGKPKAEAALGQTPGIFNKLNKWLESTGYSTINENLKAAEELVEEEVQEEPPKEEPETEPFNMETAIKTKTKKRSKVKVAKK